AAKHVRNERARDADRVDAVMRIEATVLDRDECVRHVRWQVLQRGGDTRVTARHEDRTVQACDLDRGRTLWNFERLDRRQMCADPYDRCEARDERPQR